MERGDNMNVNKLFRHYKNKYKLNITLKYSRIPGSTLADYDLGKRLIRLDREKVINRKQNQDIVVWEYLLFIKDNQSALNFLLLHEIKHAIDFRNKKIYFKCNQERYEKKANSWAYHRYNRSINDY